MSNYLVIRKKMEINNNNNNKLHPILNFQKKFSQQIFKKNF